MDAGTGPTEEMVLTMLQQETYCAQCVNQYWIAMGDFRWQPLLKKKIYVRKIIGKNGIWSEDKNLIL